MDKQINICIIGCCNTNKKTLEQAIRDNIEKELKKTLICACDKHTFIDTHDGTGEKVCAICGVRAKQAVMRFSK